MANREYPPGYFWRRLFALFVDAALAGIVASIILLPFVIGDKPIAHMNRGLVYYSECRNMTSVPQNYHDIVAPYKIEKAKWCRYKPYFVFPSVFELKLVFDQKVSQTGGVKTTTSRFYVAKVDSRLNPVESKAPGYVISLLVLIIFGAYFIQRSGVTPGKYLLGIRVQGQGCAICREFWKFAPILFINLLNFFVPEKAFWDLYTFSNLIPYVVGGLLLVFLAYYYLVPIGKWRGKMRYDQGTEFVVMRK